MLGGSAYFAFKIYEHIQTLQDPQPEENTSMNKNMPANNQVEIKEDFDTLYEKGYNLQNAGDLASAMSYYKKALEIEKNEYIHNSIASVYRANKEYTSARIHLDDSLDINPNNPITYFNYANLLLDMGNEDGAKDMYKRAIELNPDFEEAKKELNKLEEK